MLNGTAHDPSHWAKGRGRCAIHPFKHPLRCNTEESILLSLAWQYRPDLVNASAGTPSFVIRYWTSIYNASQASDAAAEIERAIAPHGSAPQRYCGFKFVRDANDDQPGTRHALKRALQNSGLKAWPPLFFSRDSTGARWRHEVLRV